MPATNRIGRVRIVYELTCECLAAGLVAADAVERAWSAAEWLRINARKLPDAMARRDAREFAVAAMRSQGGESGTTLAARAIEAARLVAVDRIKRQRYERGGESWEE